MDPVIWMHSVSPSHCSCLLGNGPLLRRVQRYHRGAGMPGRGQSYLLGKGLTIQTEYQRLWVPHSSLQDSHQWVLFMSQSIWGRPRKRCLLVWLIPWSELSVLGSYSSRLLTLAAPAGTSSSRVGLGSSHQPLLPFLWLWDYLVNMTTVRRIGLVSDQNVICLHF